MVFMMVYFGIQLMFSNYFEVGVNIEIVNMVCVNYDKGVVFDVILFGFLEEICVVQYEFVFVDLWDYKGDVVV